MDQVKTMAIILAIIVAILAGIIAWRLVVNPESGALEVTSEDGKFSFKLDVKNQAISQEAVLRAVFENEWSRAAAVDWLRRDHRMFALDDPALGAAIRDLCPDVPGEDPNARRLRVRECEENALLKQLRSSARGHAAPFQYTGVPVRVGIQEVAPHRPADGAANVCTNAPYLGQMVRLINPNSGESRELRASGMYTCIGITEEPDIQINAATAASLFGTAKPKFLDAILVQM